MEASEAAAADAELGPPADLFPLPAVVLAYFLALLLLLEKFNFRAHLWKFLCSDG